MERTIDIATGESVAFRYELAGLGSRFFALFIDLMIQFSVAGAAVVVFALAGAGLPDAPKSPLTKTESSILIALLLFAVFLLFFGYFIVFEWLWEGRTPGKRLLGIRVVRDGGLPLDFTSSVIRNCVRIVESVLFFYAISALCALLSPRNRRLGDMAAGTLVVRDLRYERVPLRDHAAAADDPVVRRFVERRPSLTADARRSLAARIAATVRPKLGANFEHLDDDALLVHLAETALA
jgi:uncharacterized RDD family membrane protein YckC